MTFFNLPLRFKTMRKLVIRLILIITISNLDGGNTYCQNSNMVDSSYIGTVRGYWIYQDYAGFEIIQIIDINDIDIINYINREKEAGVLDSNLKHWFFRSKGCIVLLNSDYISIKTSNYRFDYQIKDGQLIEYDKLGKSKHFIKVIPEMPK